MTESANSPQCKATARGTGKRCRLQAMAGLTVCNMHGGGGVNSPQGRKGRERWQEQRFGQQVQWLVGTTQPIDNPLLALQQLAGEVVAHKDLFAQRVEHLHNTFTVDDRGQEQVRADVALFERAIERCERVLSSIARLKIDERLANIEQVQAEAIVSILGHILAQFGLNIGEDSVREALRVQLRALEAGTSGNPTDHIRMTNGRQR